MNLTIDQIEQQLMDDQLPPDRLADFRVYLAAIYSARTKRMQEILAVKPSQWLEFRRGAKSAAEADRLWEATEVGMRETNLKWELRRIDRLSSAIASKLRVMADEARNIV